MRACVKAGEIHVNYFLCFFEKYRCQSCWQTTSRSWHKPSSRKPPPARFRKRKMSKRTWSNCCGRNAAAPWSAALLCRFSTVSLLFNIPKRQRTAALQGARVFNFRASIFTPPKSVIGSSGMGDSPMCLDNALVCARKSRASRPCYTTHMGESPVPLNQPIASFRLGGVRK